MQPSRAILSFLWLFLPSLCFAKPSELRVRLSSAPTTLDWNVATTGSEGAIIQNIMEGLFRELPSGEIASDLAKTYKWSADQKDLTIEIQNSVAWNDGKTLESKHFLDSFERLLNPSLNSENASLLFDIKGARDYFLGKSKDFKSVGVECPDARTLVFHLSEPRSQFIRILTHWSTFPIRKENFKLTLGPYQVSSFSKEKVELTSVNPKNSFKKATFFIISDGKIAVERFKKGELDYLLQLEDSLLNQPSLKGLPAPQFVAVTRVVALVHLNPSRIFTNSPEKRRRIMKELPVDALFSNSTHQQGSRVQASSIIPPGMTGGPSPSLRSSFQPEGKLGDLPTDALTLGYPNDALSRSIAEQLQTAPSKLKLKVEALPAGDYSQSSKRYDLIVTLFGLDYLDPEQLMSSFLTQGTHDLFNVNSAELFRIIQRARGTPDEAERTKLFKEASLYLENKIAIVMPLFYRKRAYLMQSHFSFDAGFKGSAKLSAIHLAP